MNPHPQQTRPPRRRSESRFACVPCRLWPDPRTIEFALISVGLDIFFFLIFTWEFRVSQLKMLDLAVTKVEALLVYWTGMRYGVTIVWGTQIVLICRIIIIWPNLDKFFYLGWFIWLYYKFGPSQVSLCYMIIELHCFPLHVFLNSSWGKAPSRAAEAAFEWAHHLQETSASYSLP